MASSDRANWLSALSRSDPERLESLTKRFVDSLKWNWVRAPETGLVMTRGRAGGTGSAFNLGETTATRCALRLQTGEMGVACVLGRDKAHATHVALVDALMQGDRAEAVARDVLAPLAETARARAETRARRAAATKVEFFTMTRGEG